MSNDLLSQAHAFRHASDLPQEVWDALSQDEAVANIILPFAKKALKLPRGGDDNLWIALCDKSNNVAFVLSCTKGPLDDYPIFIVPCKSFTQPAQEGHVIDIADAMEALARRLLQEVPPRRVFSVFSTANVSRAFSKAFEAQVPDEYDIRSLEVPYYEAALSSCTSETFVECVDLTFPHQGAEDIVIKLRLADMSDLGGVQSMCKKFSETSPPYVLGDEGAELEAKTMIENQQVWVHVIQQADQAPTIACLVATTRESDNVTAITKVFTAPEWLRRRCALRLLHRVCRHILFEQKKERVVLYVGTSNPARYAYSKIGFQGLRDADIQQMSDAEKWLEIGFEGTTLGYW